MQKTANEGAVSIRCFLHSLLFGRMDMLRGPVRS
jgi:hypothetical protein